MHIAFIGRGPVATNLSQLARAAGHTAVTTGRDSDPGFADAVAGADLAVLAVPFRVHETLLPELHPALEGKTLIDATNPLNEHWSPIVLPDGISGAETLARALPGTAVVKAFNTVFADIMNADDLDRAGARATTFVAGNDADAVDTVCALASDMGFDPVSCGPLSAARYLEGLAHLNIGIAVGQGGGTKAAILYHQG